MKTFYRLLLATFSAGVLSMQAYGAAGASTEVVEVVTFKLQPGIRASEFRAVDQAVEKQHVAKQPGFVSRESVAGDHGEWLVIVHWRSVKDADASMASFQTAPAAADFMSKIDTATMSMKRYGNT
jgi:heme-degrading monooxygenase HmoA